jgi:hypothetical protein
MEMQRVTEALVAAKLSRNLERPRTETDGRFARAVRLAEADGTYRKRLETNYERQKDLRALARTFRTRRRAERDLRRRCPRHLGERTHTLSRHDHFAAAARGGGQITVGDDALARSDFVEIDDADLKSTQNALGHT